MSTSPVPRIVTVRLVDRAPAGCVLAPAAGDVGAADDADAVDREDWVSRPVAEPVGCCGLPLVHALSVAATTAAVSNTRRAGTLEKVSRRGRVSWEAGRGARPGGPGARGRCRARSRRPWPA